MKGFSLQEQYPAVREGTIVKFWSIKAFVATVAALNGKRVQHGQALSASVLGVASSLEDDGTRWQRGTDLRPQSD